MSVDRVAPPTGQERAAPPPGQERPTKEREAQPGGPVTGESRRRASQLERGRAWALERARPKVQHPSGPKAT